MKFWSKYKRFHSRKCIWKYRLRNGWHFVQGRWVNIFHKKGYWFKIRMEFLRPILAKIELICQQPAISQRGGVQGVSQPALGYWIGWLSARAVFWVWMTLSYVLCPLKQWIKHAVYPTKYTPGFVAICLIINAFFFNSLAPGKFEKTLGKIIFKLILVFGG